MPSLTLDPQSFKPSQNEFASNFFVDLTLSFCRLGLPVWPTVGAARR